MSVSITTDVRKTVYIRLPSNDELCTQHATMMSKLATACTDANIICIFGRLYYRIVPLAHCVILAHYVVCLLSVCLFIVCDVLYCGETVRPSEKLSEGVNRKPGSKS